MVTTLENRPFEEFSVTVKVTVVVQ